MKRVRTFIAVDLGKKIRLRLASLQEKLREAGVEAKWVQPDNLHITLLFLGEVDMTAVPEVCAAVGETTAAHEGFPLVLSGAGCFPHARRPRVLWAGVAAGAKEICDLHGDLEGPLLDLGCYRREERKYTPHLTLGRMSKNRREIDLSPILAKYADWTAGETRVEEIHVMSSELTREGPIYTVLSRAKLA